jgi:hypothetical protein
MSTKYKTLLLQFVAVAYSCFMSVSAFSQANLPDDSRAPRSPAIAKCFPDGIFDQSDASRDGFIANGLTDYLHAISEPCLLDPAKHGAISYRLIWGGMPSARRVVVRLEVGEDGKAVLFTKVTAGRRLVSDRVESISSTQVEEFLDLVKLSDFWSLPSSENRPPVKDGTSWILEGIRDGAYHGVYRRNPKPSLYTEVGRCLGKNLAKLDDSTLFVPQYAH